jgi:hypothetical protein
MFERWYFSYSTYVIRAVFFSDMDPDLWIRICIIKAGSGSVWGDTDPDLDPGHIFYSKLQKHAWQKFKKCLEAVNFLPFHNFHSILIVYCLFYNRISTNNLEFFLRKLEFGIFFENFLFSPWIWIWIKDPDPYGGFSDPGSRSV